MTKNEEDERKLKRDLISNAMPAHLYTNNKVRLCINNKTNCFSEFYDQKVFFKTLKNHLRLYFTKVVGTVVPLIYFDVTYRLRKRDIVLI